MDEHELLHTASVVIQKSAHGKAQNLTGTDY